MQLEWSNEATLFTPINRINNTGWTMKWRWREGVEWGASPNIWENAERFWSASFCTRWESSEKFANILPVLTIQTVIPAGLCYLIFVSENKQRNQYNGANLLRRFVSEKLSIIDPLWRRRNPCNLWSHWHCCQKTNLFCEGKEGLKKGGEKRKICDH